MTCPRCRQPFTQIAEEPRCPDCEREILRHRYEVARIRKHGETYLLVSPHHVLAGGFVSRAQAERFRTGQLAAL